MRAPTSDQIRQALIADIAAYCEATGKSKEEVSKLALNDTKFISRLEGGGNVTLKSIDKVLKFINTGQSSRRGAS